MESGEWAPSDPAWKEWGLAYVQTLAANERFSLFIWPEHCLIGTKVADPHPLCLTRLSFFATLR